MAAIFTIHEIITDFSPKFYLIFVDNIFTWLHLLGGNINIAIDNKIGALVLSAFVFTMGDWPLSTSTHRPSALKSNM